MIGRLVGKIVEDGADGALVLDVNGVGYELLTPLGTLGRTGAEPNSVVTLFVHTHVREDAFVLYGFASRGERSAFQKLISVSNIGPKIGLHILGALTVSELATAIARGDTSKLTRVPGVGKKTADRIVLELKGKPLTDAPLEDLAGPQPPAPLGSKRGAQAELVHSALTRMGYRPAEAERAIGSMGARLEKEPLPDLIREALAVLTS